MELRKPSKSKLALLLRSRVQRPDLPPGAWKVTDYQAGRTHKGEPVILVQLKQVASEHPEIREAYAFAALHPTSWKIHGVTHAIRRRGYTDLEPQGGWMIVKPEGRGIGTMLMAHALERSREWNQNVHVSSDVLNAGFFARLMKLGVEKVQRRREAFVPRESLRGRPWKEYLLKPERTEPRRRR